jgi:hypothetical protein
MSSWSDFEAAAPQIAAFARERLHGRVSYLATVQADGGPRVHPVTPIVGGGRLFLFMEPTSPKGRDLQRDGRFALHCGVEDNSGGAGEVAAYGRAELVTTPEQRALAVASASYTPAERYILFELHLDAVHTLVYQGDGTRRERWRAE